MNKHTARVSVQGKPMRLQLMVVPLWHGEARGVKTRGRDPGSMIKPGAALVLIKIFLSEDTLGLILFAFPRLYSSRTKDLSHGQGDKDVTKIE